MRIKVALPKGRLLDKTAALLEKAGWGLDGYNKELRLYHIKSTALHKVEIKVFHEKDIPVQVAVGNYDLGICGSDWVEELLAKFPSSTVVRVAASIATQMMPMLLAVSATSIARVNSWYML